MPYSPTDIGTAGEMHTAAWLEANGYATNVNTKLPGATDIDAWNGTTRLLVQVKTAVQPGIPAGLTNAEVQAITPRAGRIQAQAWSAHVTVDSSLRLMGTVSWRKL